MVKMLTVAAVTFALLLSGGFAREASAHDTRSLEIIELNSRIMHQQILARDAALFQEAALEQFLVVAPVEE